MGGGAPRARPEFRRMMSASDRRNLAFCGRLSPPRIAPAAAWTGHGRWFSRSGTCLRSKTPNPPQARSGPAPMMLLKAESTSLRSEVRVQPRPGGWLGLLLLAEKQAASGATMVTASFRNEPHVTANPERHSPPPGPLRSRSIRQREGRNHDTGLEGGDEIIWNGAASALSQKREVRPTCPFAFASPPMDETCDICHKRVGTRLPLFIERGRAVD